MKKTSEEDLRKIALFDKLWKEDISFFPGVPVDWKEREPFRLFAEQVYNHIIDHVPIGELLDEAYNDGYTEGQKD